MIDNGSVLLTRADIRRRSLGNHRTGATFLHRLLAEDAETFATPSG